MNDLVYYRSNAPEVLAAHADWVSRRANYCELGKALMAEFPGCELMESRGWANTHICGITFPQKPGVGWVRSNRGDYWEPNYKSAAGKALWRKLNSISWRDPSFAGMPREISVPDHLKSHSLHHLNGVVWVGWDVPAEEIEASEKFNLDLWTRAKASEYHLAKEAREATKEVPA